MCLKILEFGQKELHSNREGLTIFFWQDQVLHVPVWPQVHPLNWSQTNSKDDTATSALAAARLQHWSLFLSSYQCEIEFKHFAEVAPMRCPDYHCNIGRVPA